MKVISNLIEAHLFRRNEDQLEFLALRRSEKVYYPNLWQMVNGKIQEEELAFNTALREMKEETGLSPLKLWTLPNINSFYSSKDDCIFMIPVFVAEVEAESVVILSSEHTDYRWVNKNEMIDILAWPGQKKSVHIIYDYFSSSNEFIDLIEIKIK